MSYFFSPAAIREREERAARAAEKERVKAELHAAWIEEVFYDAKARCRLTMRLTDEDCYSTPYWDPTPVTVGYDESEYARETAMVRRPQRDILWARGARRLMRRKVNQGKPVGIR